MTAYYNEHDKFAAAWLRELIAEGMIPPGDVDERDIQDIIPTELRGYDQHHFFAGIGVWPLALRAAGWPDNRPIASGSCPCQPFSAAGGRSGFADERHLWPAFHHIITQCGFPVVVGEQVASKDGLGWLDLVSSDMEASGYTGGAFDLCAAGATVEWEGTQSGEWLRRAIRDCPDPRLAAQLRDFAEWAGTNLGEGGAHIRQRLYFGWMADADHTRSQGWGEPRRECAAERSIGASGLAGGVADRARDGRREERPNTGGSDARDRAQGLPAGFGAGGGGGRLADTANGDGRSGERGAQTGAGPDEQRGRGPSGGGAGGKLRFRGSGSDWRPVGGVDNAASSRHVGTVNKPEGDPRDQARLRLLSEPSSIGGVADADGGDGGEAGAERSGQHGCEPPHYGDGRSGGGGFGNNGLRPGMDNGRSGPDHGIGGASDWLYCRDGSWRPVEPGTFPLVDAGAFRNRVGELRGAGNAIHFPIATRFIEALMETMEGGW